MLLSQLMHRKKKIKTRQRLMVNLALLADLAKLHQLVPVQVLLASLKKVIQKPLHQPLLLKLQVPRLTPIKMEPRPQKRLKSSKLARLLPKKHSRASPSTMSPRNGKRLSATTSRSSHRLLKAYVTMS